MLGLETGKFTSLQCVEAGAVEHLLLDLGAVWTPAHEEDLGLKGRLGAVRVELVVVVVDAVTTVVRVTVRLVEVCQEVTVTVVTISHLKKVLGAGGGAVKESGPLAYW